MVFSEPAGTGRLAVVWAIDRHFLLEESAAPLLGKPRTAFIPELAVIGGKDAFAAFSGIVGSLSECTGSPCTASFRFGSLFLRGKGCLAGGGDRGRTVHKKAQTIKEGLLLFSG